jgi:hypothetical protein
MPVRLRDDSKRAFQLPHDGRKSVLRMPEAGQRIIVHDNT